MARDPAPPRRVAIIVPSDPAPGADDLQRGSSVVDDKIVVVAGIDPDKVGAAMVRRVVKRAGIADQAMNARGFGRPDEIAADVVPAQEAFGKVKREYLRAG